MKGLGPTIKALRRMKHITLHDMSKKSGFDPATLSRIENEKMTGTVESHMKIASILGYSLPEIYEEAMKRATEGKEKALKDKNTIFSHSTGAVSELLVSSVMTRRMMPVRIRLKPGASTEKEEYSTISEKFILVLSGQITLVVDGQETTISENEHIYFKASVPHFIKNTTRAEADCLSVMTPVSL